MQIQNIFGRCRISNWKTNTIFVSLNVCEKVTFTHASRKKNNYMTLMNIYTCFLQKCKKKKTNDDLDIDFIAGKKYEHVIIIISGARGLS